MNRHTARLMKFVLYSPQALVHNNGAGFWSNKEGWVEFAAATQFTVESVSSCNLSWSDALDAEWILWESETAAAGVVPTRHAQSCSLLSAY